MIPDLLLALKRVGPISVPVPCYQTAGSSGLDLHAALAEAIEIGPLERVKIPTGLAFAIPEKFEGQIRPRSGLAAKTGVTILNAPGTIDSDYRGEVLILLVNLSHTVARIEPMDRIAQLVLAPVARAEVTITELSETKRGDGGFGSTGKA